jgi:nucleotide-binding universal stress UspA family protein
LTVVVGVDNSARSKAALRLAAHEARWRHTPLVAVTAYEPPLAPVGGYPAAAKHTAGEERANAEAALRATVDDELGDQAAQADLRISEGIAGRVIVEAARETHAQLVVLAARPGKPTVPGTVSHYVLLKARCPVTIVPSSDVGDDVDGRYDS